MHGHTEFNRYIYDLGNTRVTLPASRDHIYITMYIYICMCTYTYIWEDAVHTLYMQDKMKCNEMYISNYINVKEGLIDFQVL